MLTEKRVYFVKDHFETVLAYVNMI